MKTIRIVLFVSVLSLFNTTNIKAQSNPSIEELQQFFNGQQLQITWRDGEVRFGTYYFLEVHYCPNGYYGLYGNSVKNTVLGNEQRDSWQEYGQWKIMTQNGVNGIHYLAQNGGQNFYPLYKTANGDLYLNEITSIVRKGPAICQ